MKKIVYLIVLFIAIIIEARGQFEAVGYDFSGSATSLLLNPGTKINYQKAFGIPVFSNTRLFAGNTGFSLYDLFAPGTGFDEKFYRTLDKLENTDFVLVNIKNEMFNYGWTDDLMRFKYFGMYLEFDHITYFPADFIRLGVYGNAADIYHVYDAKYLASKTDLIETFYFGINKTTSFDLSIGYRFKLYSGIANAQTVGNSGQFYTVDGQRNFYIHHLDNIDIEAQSSGYNENEDTASYYLSKFLFSGNYGLGFDFGLSYRYSDKISLSFSVLDLGFIYYRKDINNYKISGDYQFEGIEIQFSDNYEDYWADITDEFNEKVIAEDNTDPYFSIRPASFYFSLKYGMGDLKNQSCKDFMNPRNEYNNYIGITAYSQLRPVKAHVGISGFYEKKWSSRLSTKINLSMDNYSYSSIGAGLLWTTGKLQWTVTMDNLYGLTDLAKSRKQSLQIGLNLLYF